MSYVVKLKGSKFSKLSHYVRMYKQNYRCLDFFMSEYGDIFGTITYFEKKNKFWCKSLFNINKKILIAGKSEHKGEAKLID